MAKILKNQTGSAIVINDTGVTVPASPATYTIPEQDFLIWAASVDIVTEINSGDIVVNDGTQDLSISDAVRFLAYPDRIEVQDNGSQVALVQNTLNFIGASVVDAGSGKTTIDLTGADQLVKVSSNDTTSGFLSEKLIVSDESNSTNRIELKEVNDGADEDLKIAFDETKVDHDNLLNYVAGQHTDAQVKVSSNDTTPDYLLAKLVVGDGITLTEQNDGSNESIKIDSTHEQVGDVILPVCPDASQKATYSGDNLSALEFFKGATQTTPNRRARLDLTYTGDDLTTEAWKVYDPSDGTTILKTITLTHVYSAGVYQSTTEVTT